MPAKATYIGKVENTLLDLLLPLLSALFLDKSTSNSMRMHNMCLSCASALSVSVSLYSALIFPAPLLFPRQSLQKSFLHNLGAPPIVYVVGEYVHSDTCIHTHNNSACTYMQNDSDSRFAFVHAYCGSSIDWLWPLQVPEPRHNY